MYPAAEAFQVGEAADVFIRTHRPMFPSKVRENI